MQTVDLLVAAIAALVAGEHIAGKGIGRPDTPAAEAEIAEPQPIGGGGHAAHAVHRQRQAGQRNQRRHSTMRRTGRSAAARRAAPPAPRQSGRADRTGRRSQARRRHRGPPRDRRHSRRNGRCGPFADPDNRSESPCPRQSNVATVKPRRVRSPTVSKYFSMHSCGPAAARPCRNAARCRESRRNGASCRLGRRSCRRSPPAASDCPASQTAESRSSPRRHMGSSRLLG